jgi:hypothetical protein
VNFRLDTFAGKSQEELHADCWRLLRVASDRERIIMQMIEFIGGDRVDELPEPARDYAKRLIEAYKD